MPQNTARGYTYPLYTDPHDFPADMLNFATDVDTDVQAQINLLASALDAPSVRVSATASQAIAANVDTTLTWSTEDYDNAGMFVIGSPTILTFTEAGIYLLSASALWTSNTDSTLSGCGLRINSSVGGIRVAHDVRRGVDSTPDTISTDTHVSTLHVVPAAGETVNVIARHNLAVGSAVTIREFTATKLTVDG